MSLTLKFCLQRQFLTRLLQTAALSLALMTASAVGVHADTVTVVGANGADGASGVNPGDYGQPGGDGGPATANASDTSPLNSATAIGGNGGNGGNIGPPADWGLGYPGGGGGGGAAMATAATSITSGPAGAAATANAGNGGSPGSGNDGEGAFAGPAKALATSSSGNGSASASASATGGNGGFSVDIGGAGGDASATSKAIANGSGDASSSANATGGEGDPRVDQGGNATAKADALATGGGKAVATAVATAGESFFGNSPQSVTANATSDAETTNGAMAKAQSTAFRDPLTGAQATATAKTSFSGVSVMAMSTIIPLPFGGVSTLTSVTTQAIAQGGSAQAFVDPGETAAAIATVLPDKAFATTLIGDASNVADALLGPRDEIFGIANFGGSGDESSTFDFNFEGDLLLGVIADGFFDIVVNGIGIPFEDAGNNSVIDLGHFASNLELTIEGDGVFAFGGAVPEPSTWAMMLVGIAGLGFLGCRTTDSRRSSRALRS